MAKSGTKWEAVERSRFTDAVAVKQVNNLSFSVFVGKRGDLGQQIPSFRRATAERSS